MTDCYQSNETKIGIRAEAAGKAAFLDRSIPSYLKACRAARERYSTAYLRDCFVMGWNRAQWATEFPSLDEAKPEYTR